MRKLRALAMLVIALFALGAFAQTSANPEPAQAAPIIDGDIPAPAPDPIVGVGLVRLEATLTSPPFARIVFAYYRQSGAIEREDGIAVTDGDPATTADDLLTGNPLNGEPLGLIAALGVPLEGEAALSPTFRMRRRVMVWLKNAYPDRFANVTVQ